MHFIQQWSRMLRSTSADHRCCPRCLITDNLYNVMLLESLAVLANVFIFYHSSHSALTLRQPWCYKSLTIKQQVGSLAADHNIDENFQKWPSWPDCKWVEASQFWFVRFCACAKARYNFHKDSMPMWTSSTICYRLWANLPPHCLISYSRVLDVKDFHIIMNVSIGIKVQLLRTQWSYLYPIVSSLSAAANFF